MKKKSLLKIVSFAALCVMLVFTLALIGGCKGSDGAQGAAGTNGTNGSNGTNGQNGLNAGDTAYTATIDSVTTSQSGTAVTFTVNFSIKADNGARIAEAGDTNATNATRLAYIRLAYAKLEPGTNGDSSVWTSYNQGERSPASLTDHGDGTYTYVCSPIDAAVFDAAATTRVGLQVSGLAGRDPKNVVHDFVPDGSAITVTRDIVTTAACDKCHDTNGVLAHGSRYETKYCVVCHNPATSRNGHTVDFKSLIHEIHTSQTTSALDASAVTYPQDIRNCAQCHQGTQGDNWQNVPTIEACGSCHTTVNFATGANHPGGVRTSNVACAGCHDAASIAGYHVPVALPDPNDPRLGGTNTHTNAEFIAAAGAVPTGAHKITYVISGVTTTNGHPSITFKLQSDGTDMVFSTPTSTTSELMANYAGSPSAYFAWAVPQDGIDAPADFNTTTSSYIRNAWNGADANSTMTGPDGSGFYTLTKTSVTIPATAVMLTGGIGYTYGSGSPPLVQTNLTAYPYSAATGSGGLSVPAPNQWTVAAGYTGRRVVVDTAKCDSCHGALGVEPTFHAGQRNDAPTCSFCHNPNRANNGWIVNASTFVHAIHGAGKRTVPFTWHATDAVGFSDVAYPGILNDCQQCHVAGGYDFSLMSGRNPVYTDALMNSMLLSTAASGTATAGFSMSPYVTDGVNYGGSDAGNNLVNSPIAAACFSCHDSTTARAHMEANGGSIYDTRTNAMTKVEQCLVCHGPGRQAAIADVHK